MKPGLLLSVIVPTYNERERLQEFVETVVRVLERQGIAGELVIVDDNSPDGTGDLADRLAASHPITAVHRAGKLGLGSAVMAGCAAAQGVLLAVMDADLSHPPETLPALLAALGDGTVEMAVASRYVPGGGTRNWPLSRRLLSRAGCLLARSLTPVRDAASGFFVMRRGVIRDVEVKAAGFKICLELLVRGNCGSVAEVPYVFCDRAAGESKMSYREAMGYGLQLYALWRWRRAKRPNRQVRHTILAVPLAAPPADAVEQGIPT